MHRQNVIVFSSEKNKRGTHEIARGLDGGVCRAVMCDEFFNRTYCEEYPHLVGKRLNWNQVQ